MKPRLAFLYNVRHRYPSPEDPRTQLETDFDDPPVIRSMIGHLRRAGFSVIPIEANDRAYLKLYRNRTRIDLAFNYAEGIYGQDRECHIPAILEMLQIPYLGCAPLSAALVLNKAKAKEVLLAHGVPTLPFQLFNHEREKLQRGFKFPLIVKPVSQGSSAGITNKSVVRTAAQLKAQVAWVRKTFGQSALVEPFLKGREFSVPMLGNPPKVLPIIEACHRKLPAGYERIDSLEVKWFFEEETSDHHLSCPAKMSGALRKKVTDICYETWKALDLRDWCRIDIRCNEKGLPFVLEVNVPAGLIPPEQSMTSYFPLAARVAGINYQQLLKTLVQCAQTRLGRT